jgi:hypothetical protein
MIFWKSETVYASFEIITHKQLPTVVLFLCVSIGAVRHIIRKLNQLEQNLYINNKKTF